MRSYAMGGLMLVAVLVPAPASACRSHFNHRAIFFERWPAPIASPVAAKITILEVSYEHGKRPTGLARIEEVLKGDLPKKVIRLILPIETSCGPFVQVGQSGIALGTPLADGSLQVIDASYKDMHPEKH